MTVHTQPARQRINALRLHGLGNQPRNPLVAPSMRRLAGRHDAGLGAKAQRQQAKRATRAEIRQLAPSIDDRSP